MHAEEGINWVHALPRALRIYHDTVNEYGVSPYEMVFGRERNLAGIPRQPVHDCQSTEDFLAHTALVDKKMAVAIMQEHEKIQRRVNQDRPA